MKTQLLETIAQSQDGNPRKAIMAESSDGRLCSVSDNLNRLLADIVNVALEDNPNDHEAVIRDVEDDLEYVIRELLAADRAVKSIV